MVGVFSLATGHILSYGTLLGTTFFHTFVSSVIAYQNLTRPQFGALMGNIFPVYFSIQSAIPVILVYTYPSGPSAQGGIVGILHSSNRWGGLVPIATIFFSAMANLLIVGPATTRTMNSRRLQERKDGKKSHDPPPHSQEMEALNKKFGALHGISSLLNLATFVSCLVYGVKLASRLE
ncbi:hypothetical protein GQ53DRAFT_779668 [Thozetella sp. PMI_491]|nr:hypothetical protein GQ53DRAFT_779668 [Thozetella sp. PMI_491]